MATGGSVNTTPDSNTSTSSFELLAAPVLDPVAHLQPVKSALWEAGSQWRDIGRALGLTDGTIRTIRNQDDGECLQDVLAKWMYSGEATTHDLNKALEDPTVGRGDIANKIWARKGNISVYLILL